MAGRRWMSLLVMAIGLAACAGATGDGDTREDAVGDEGTPGDADATSGQDGDDPGGGTRDWAGVTSTAIVLADDGITIDGPGASADGSTVTITAAGTYRLSGALTDGQVRVDTADTEPVQLVLEGIDVASSLTAPLYVVAAEDVLIYLEADSHNRLVDAVTYVYASAEEDEPNAALFSKADLAIEGPGSLAVEGRAYDGIASKDSLRVAGGVVTVQAADDGVRGKDEIAFDGGTWTVTAGGDGLKSDNDEDDTRGTIVVTGGALDVTAGGDGLSAVTTVTVSGGSLALTTGGGHAEAVATDASAKGIKGVSGVVVTGGALTIDAADDAVHTNGDVTIGGGALTLASGDDGVHADGALTVDDGTLTVTTCYEGLEATIMTINGGTVRVRASDDGLNVAGGADASGEPEGWPGAGADTSGYLLTINGGYVALDADGDGVDSNGDLAINGGVVLVNGPTESMNGALDYGDGQANTFTISGGLLVAAGSVGMAVAPGTGSSQYSVLVNLTSAQPAGTLFHLESVAGDPVVTFAPVKAWQSVAFSSPDLAKGSTYAVYVGGADSGTVNDSLIDGSVYTPGALFQSFTVSTITTQVGQAGGGPGGPDGPGGGF